MSDRSTYGTSTTLASPIAKPIGEQTRAQSHSVWTTLGVCGLLIACALLVYKSVLFDFFVCDDYTHLTWLQSAIKHPEMIWKNFYGSWLDFQTLKFYRPLITCTLATDYILYGQNGVGYHVTNVLLHAGTAIFLYLFCREVACTVSKQRDSVINSVWAACAAILFVVHPLHPEVVSWITGRVDSVMALFLSASLWCYMRWHHTRRRQWFGASAVACLLSLGSKEMAVTIPPTLLALEFFCLNEEKNLKAKAFTALRNTSSFWLILAGYFVFRRIVLGTFVGGYGDNLGLTASLHDQLGQWWHSFRMIAVPANVETVPAGFRALTVWTKASIICGSAAMIAMCVNRETRRIGLFLLAWCGLAVIPVYKIFAIGTMLQGSRLAYLVSLPICALLTLPIFAAAKFKEKPVRIAALTTVVVLSAALCYSGTALLLRNNRAWVAAGSIVNKLRDQGRDIFSHVDSQTQVYFFNVPDTVHGAYAGQGVGAGLKNFDASKKLKVLSVGDNFGFHKSILMNPDSTARGYWWDETSERFIPLSPSVGTALSRNPSAPQQINCEQYAAEIKLPDGIDDFIEIPITVVSGKVQSVGLRITTPIEGSQDFWTTLDGNGQNSRVWFNLHQYAPAAFAGEDIKLVLLLPAPARYEIGAPIYHSATTTIPAAALTPAMSDDPSALDVTAGNATIRCTNASSLNAETVELEVTRGAQYFPEPNSPKPYDKSLLTRSASAKNATFRLSQSDFPGPGIHQGRLRAVDATGKTIGFTGDPFFVVVR